jgi:Tol biopolymer transport system component
MRFEYFQKKPVTLLVICFMLTALFTPTSLLSIANAQDKATGNANAESEAGPPNLAELSQTAVFNLEKFEIAPATWGVLYKRGKLERSTTVTVDGAFKRIDFYETTEGVKKRACRLYSRDGVWYIHGFGRKVKTFPYGFTFPDPIWDMLMQRTMPQPVPPQIPGKYMGTKEGVAYYKLPLPKETMVQIGRMIKRAETMLKYEKDRFKRSDWQKKIRQMNAAVYQGMIIRVDLNTGFLLDFGDLATSTQLQNFKWLSKVDRDTFLVTNETWSDDTADLSLGQPNDLAVITHAPAWTPTTTNVPSNVVLINIRTNQFRKLPFPSPSLFAIGFANKRSDVILGTITPRGMLLFKLNLKSGKSQMLGDGKMEPGMITSAEVSPDGTKVALSLKATPSSTSTMVYTININTGHSKLIGNVTSADAVTWTPSGDGVVMMKVKRNSKGTVTSSQIISLSTTGQQRILRDGLNPVVIRKLNKIMFVATKDGKPAWFLCDLNGKNEKPIGSDGLSNLLAPAPSPDGMSVIMMQPQKEAAPSMYVVNLQTGQRRRLNLPTGAWSYPAWR